MVCQKKQFLQQVIMKIIAYVLKCMEDELGQKADED